MAEKSIEKKDIRTAHYFEKVRNENAPFYENTGLDYYRLKKN